MLFGRDWSFGANGGPESRASAAVKSREPIPLSWTLIAVVGAVLVVDVATQGKLGFSAGLVGLVVAVVIGADHPPALFPDPSVAGSRPATGRLSLKSPICWVVSPFAGDWLG